MWAHAFRLFISFFDRAERRTCLTRPRLPNPKSIPPATCIRPLPFGARTANPTTIIFENTKKRTFVVGGALQKRGPIGARTASRTTIISVHTKKRIFLSEDSNRRNKTTNGFIFWRVFFFNKPGTCRGRFLICQI